MKGEIRVCEVCGETSEVKRVNYWSKFGMTLCFKHMNQYKRHGRFYEKTIYDPNEFKEFEDYAIMYIYNLSGDVIGEGKIDLEDIERVKKFKWGEHGNGYLSTMDEGKRLFLHRYIKEPKGSLIIDHINRDTYDNRKSNLRATSMSRNIMNSKKPKNNNSGVKGIIWDKEREKWRAEIQRNSREKTDRSKLGKRFDSFDDAVKQRLMWESELFKEYSNNYSHTSNLIELSYLNPQDNQPTTIQVNLQGEITLFTKQNLS